MSEKTELQVSTKESVALELTMYIANNEELSNDKESYRKNVLDLYAECLYATNGFREI